LEKHKNARRECGDPGPYYLCNLEIIVQIYI
jgi:hypothetical protein